MALPTKRQLMVGGVYAVLHANDFDETGLDHKVKNWLKLPDVKAAAEKDAERHLTWGRKHGNSLDNCEVPHNNLFRVLAKYL